MMAAPSGSRGLVPCVCTDLAFGGWDTLKAIDAVAAAGVPAIEFWGWRDKDLDAIAERSRRHGLQIAAMSLDPAVRILDGDAVPEFLKSVEDSLAAARRIGCRRLVVHVQQVPMGSGPSRLHDPAREPVLKAQRRNIAAALKRAAPLAEAAGVVLMLEPLNILVDHAGYCLSCSGDGAEVLRRLMGASQEILAQHAVNRARRERGQRPATSIWLWGQGKRPLLPTLRQRFGIEGSVISAVDLVNGLGILAGLAVIKVPGVTGFLDTNYHGKATYGVRALREKDLVFVHVEATDETGHMGDVHKKIQAVEDFDSKIVAPILEGLREFAEWRLLMMPDHATPCALKTHSADPVPFVVVEARDLRGGSNGRAYNERAAAATGLVVAEAHTLLPEYLVRT